MHERARLLAKVHGKVQGVYFRAFVAEEARKLGVTGFARNLPDLTTVEVEAEGERQRLEELLDRLKVGPSRAKVLGVETEWSEYKGTFKGFDVAY